MQTKAYFASSVPAALDLARQELGTEALLVGSRPAPANARQLGRFEVTFAYEPDKRDTENRSTNGRITSERTAGSAKASPSELDDIRKQLSALRMAVGRSSAASTSREPDFTW